MSYKDFTVRKVIDGLGYQVKEQAFLSSMKIVPEPPSEKLQGAVELLRKALVFSSEKSRSESLIAPILSEAATRVCTTARMRPSRTTA